MRAPFLAPSLFSLACAFAFTVVACSGKSVNEPRDSGPPEGDSGAPDTGRIDVPRDAASPDAGREDAGADSGSTPADSGAEDATPDGDPGNDPDAAPVLPPPPTNPTPPSAVAHNFVLHHLHLGDESAASWDNLGYNLDGKVTTAQSTDVCALAANANRKNQNDGVSGVDNSFGATIVPLLQAIVPTPSTAADDAFANGTVGLLLDVTGLTADPAQSSAGLTGQFFLGAPFGQAPNAAAATPTFTTADDWPLDPRTVASAIGADGKLALPVTSNTPFTTAYVTSGDFVGHAPTVTLVIPISGVPLTLNVSHAIVTFRHDASHHAAQGIIAGVIPTNDLIASFRSVVGSISSSLCTATAFAQIETALAAAADILSDGSNAAGVPCDAVSIGVGFDADEIGAPQVAGQPAVTPDPCGDGG